LKSRRNLFALGETRRADRRRTKGRQLLPSTCAVPAAKTRRLSISTSSAPIKWVRTRASTAKSIGTAMPKAAGWVQKEPYSDDYRHTPRLGKPNSSCT